MNHRDRFIATMHYQPKDRVPLYDFNFWDETIPEWHKAGLPKTVTQQNAWRYFGLDASLAGGDQDWDTNTNVEISPFFTEEVLEDRGDSELFMQANGVKVVRSKYMGSIPMHEGHTLVDRESWEKHFKWRFDPDHPDRYKDWDRKVKRWTDPNRQHPNILWAGSIYGVTRNAMGLEGISMLVYDDPALFEEMVITRTDCMLAIFERIYATGATFEVANMSEDMAYNAGSMISPEHFKQFLSPHYKRITDYLRSHGTDVLWMDSDGKIDELIPLFLEVGVNCMFPIEVGTWGADPVKYRKQFGKDLLMMGGFDKHILMGDPRGIEAEIHRLTPLVEEGGYIPFPDHRVPPDVPLENYLFYCKKAREIWGRGMNLEPMGAEG